MQYGDSTRSYLGQWYRSKFKVTAEKNARDKTISDAKPLHVVLQIAAADAAAQPVPATRLGLTQFYFSSIFSSSEC